MVETRLAIEVGRDLFSAGDLEMSRDFLIDALKNLPETDEPLAGSVARAELHHALARVAEAQGDWIGRLRNLLSAEHELRRVLPADHPLVLVARSRSAQAEMEKGYSDSKADYIRSSKRRLQQIVRDSRKRLGRDNPIAMKAELAIAVANAALGYTEKAIHKIDGIIARLRELDDKYGKSRDVMLAAAMVTKARLLNIMGRADEAKALSQEAAKIGENLTDRPVRTIVYTPEAYASGRTEGQPRRRFAAPSSGAGSMTISNGAFALNDLGLRTSQGFSAKDFTSQLSGSWVEISLCVASDGSAHDVQMVRYDGSKRWAENAVKVAAHYRYLPPRSLAQDDCLPQMLRLTVVSQASTRATGSHLQQREQNILIRSFDLLGHDLLNAGYLAATARVPDDEERSGQGKD
ncbi:MAG: hypothetical protein D6757_05050 [Alphaproteobacteria bacterium]|nr:MAG: hypothetical protein D6757_05050 [Alphaproteobacteria bacterium]